MIKKTDRPRPGSRPLIKNPNSLERDTTAANKERVLKALVKHNGLISYAIKAANIASVTHYTYMDNDAEYRRKVQEAILRIRETVVDVSESKLFKKINQEDLTAIIFHLKCQGKSRGYVERQEQKLMGDADNPVVPKNFVESTIATLIEAERKRLSAENTDQG